MESEADKNVASASSDAAAFCADLVRSHDFERYAATLFVPAAERRALLALYAFNVEIVRVRDLVTQPLPGEIRLQWWTDMLSGQAHGGVEGNPVAAELLLAIHDFNLPAERLSRLVEEHRLDLYGDSMPTMAALQGYLTDTCSVLFAVAAQIVAPSSATDHLARHAGLALGLTKVIARLPGDTSRHRLFLPLELLESDGSGVEEVFACKDTPALRMALGRVRDEAGQHLATASSLLADVSPPARVAFLPLALVRRDLARLSRADRNPFLPQPESRLRTLWTLWRASRSREFAR